MNWEDVLSSISILIIYKLFKVIEIINLYNIMADFFIVQKVANFESSRAHLKQNQLKEESQQQDQDEKFSDWNLHLIINHLNLKQYRIKWIGQENDNYLDAFLYSVLKLCKYNQSLFMMLKYHLYEIASQNMKMIEQRKLIKALNELEECSDVGKYLNRSSVVKKLLEKNLSIIFEKGKYPLTSHFQGLQTLSESLPFLQFSFLASNMIKISHFLNKMYIVKEKNCCFVVESMNFSEQELLAKRKKKTIQPRVVESSNSSLNLYKPTDVSERREPRLGENAVPKFLLNNKKSGKKNFKINQLQLQSPPQTSISKEQFLQLHKLKIEKGKHFLMNKTEHLITEPNSSFFLQIRGSLQPNRNQALNPESRRIQNNINTTKNSTKRSHIGSNSFTKIKKVVSGDKQLRIQGKREEGNNQTRSSFKKIELSLKKLMSPKQKNKSKSMKENSEGTQTGSYFNFSHSESLAANFICNRLEQNYSYS